MKIPYASFLLGLLLTAAGACPAPTRGMTEGELLPRSGKPGYESVESAAVVTLQGGRIASPERIGKC